ncbi:MAG: sugar ABC transporter substrate-binding protein [Spirochaetia bacterium]|jgi:ribose transport system substrate-binding protein|nr:sugar ABC transporter substrate-binding protein [Spirochaetia bacterium]
MKKVGMVLLSLALLVPSVAFAQGSEESATGSEGQKTLKVAVVLKTLSSEYWQRVASGCDDAAKELGVEVTKLGPPTEDAVVQQINMVEDSLANKPDALVFSPSQPTTAERVINKAMSNGVPVIIIDSPMPSDFTNYNCFIGTANYEAGKEGAEFMVKQMNGKIGSVVIIEGAPGNPTCTDRANGAEEVFKKAGFKIVSRQPGYSDKEKGFNVMQNVLQTTSNVDIVFCANDEMALGAQRACAQAKVPAKVVGFDGNKSAIQSILKDEMFATVAQKPEAMGKLGIEYAVKAIKGEKFDKTIDSGIEIITKENAQAALDKLQK